MSAETVVETYSFRRDELAPEIRTPGVSAFMRIRNGAEFLEATIRSHIDHFDEIVAVYNQCTDATPDILQRLAQEYRPKLRVFHYVPRVFPPGSEGHKKEPPDSPHSLVNYYNFALARTRFAVATKLDDDHLAMERPLHDLMRTVRANTDERRMICFSGLNLARNGSGAIGVLADDPFSGNGDIGFFRVSRQTYFAHDRRFERFHRAGLQREFGGVVYWHLKYLKKDLGFANYELDANPDSRYARRRATMPRDHLIVEPAEIVKRMPVADRLVAASRKIGLPLPEKLRLRADRWDALFQNTARPSNGIALPFMLHTNLTSGA